MATNWRSIYSTPITTNTFNGYHLYQTKNQEMRTLSFHFLILFHGTSLWWTSLFSNSTASCKIILCASTEMQIQETEENPDSGCSQLCSNSTLSYVRPQKRIQYATPFWRERVDHLACQMVDSWFHYVRGKEILLKLRVNALFWKETPNGCVLRCSNNTRLKSSSLTISNISILLRPGRNLPNKKRHRFLHMV